MFFAIFIGILVLALAAGVRIITEYERGVVFRLGRFSPICVRPCDGSADFCGRQSRRLSWL